MSRRGYCHDYVDGESFFQLLKPERIKKKIRGTREVACSGIFYHIEMFYDRKFCYRYNNMQPPKKKMGKYKQ